MSGRKRYRLGMLLASALLLVALARPVLQQEVAVEPISGAPVILALDASYSMQANDITPNRYKAAADCIGVLLECSHNDLFSLVVFTTNALVLSPMSRDHALTKAALQAFNPKFLLTKGTDLSSLFTHIETMQVGPANVVIFSDGGDWMRKERPVPEGLDSLNLIAVGMATRAGALLKDRYGNSVKRGDGNPVVSRLNRAYVQDLQDSGALFLPFDNPAATAARIADHLRYKDVLQNVKTFRQRELFWIPLLLAAFCYLAANLSIGKKVVWLLGLAGLQMHAGIFDFYRIDQAEKSYQRGDYVAAYKAYADLENWEGMFNAALSLYRAGEYKSAYKRFAVMKSEDLDRKALLYFYLGNCAVKNGAYEDARLFYLKSLALKFDEDTRFNLSCILFLQEPLSRNLLQKKQQNKKGDKTPSESQPDKIKEGGGVKGQNLQAQSGGAGAGKKNKGESTGLGVTVQKHPLGSTTYDLINKGYVHEETPW